MNVAELRAAIKGDVVAESDAGYEEAISRWAVNAIQRAKVVVFVKNEEEVGLAIRFARTNNLRIAIRGGGHSPGGASSSEGGLVIDLSRYMIGVRVDVEKQIAYVQGGAVWRTVDEEAIKHGLAAVGGSVNHTGVAGSTLGGGYGWLSGQYGLIIDNLLGATVVTADSFVLEANEDENPDLFYALRGGGSNFGVVTELVFQLHPQQPTVFAGPLIFGGHQIEQLGAALDAWLPNADPKEGIQTAMTRGPDGRPCCIALVFYNGSEAEGRERFKAFYDLKPVMDLAKEMPYELLNTLINENAKPGDLVWMQGKLRNETPSKNLSMEMLAAIGEMSSEFVPLVVTEFFPHDVINSVPADKTPYRRNLPGNACAIMHWHDNSPEATAKAKEHAAHLASLVGTTGLGYGNYIPDTDLVATGEVGTPGNRAEQLFDESYAKMQQIKKKYDPEMVFNKWFAITPA